MLMSKLLFQPKIGNYLMNMDYCRMQVELSRKTVSLPIYPTLTDQGIDIILSAIS